MEGFDQAQALCEGLWHKAKCLGRHAAISRTRMHRGCHTPLIMTLLREQLAGHELLRLPGYHTGLLGSLLSLAPRRTPAPAAGWPGTVAVPAAPAAPAPARSLPAAAAVAAQTAQAAPAHAPHAPAPAAAALASAARRRRRPPPPQTSAATARYRRRPPPQTSAAAAAPQRRAVPSAAQRVPARGGRPSGRALLRWSRRRRWAPRRVRARRRQWAGAQAGAAPEQQWFASRLHGSKRKGCQVLIILSSCHDRL